MSEQKVTTAIKAGELLTIESGEYSDYGVLGIFRAKVDFVPDEVMNEYLDAHPDERASYSGTESKFIAWLENTKGLIEPVEYRGWHIGSYGNFSTVLT